MEDALNEGSANDTHIGNPREDTGDFNPFAPGNLRVDYVLPSVEGLKPVGAGVFWPTSDSPLDRLINPAFGAGGVTDHRLVYVDVEIPSAIQWSWWMPNAYSSSPYSYNPSPYGYRPSRYRTPPY